MPEMPPGTVASPSVDFLWPAHALIVETDGYEAHGTRRAFEADRARDAALTAGGYRVVTFTWDTDDATVVGRLGALLSPGGSRPRSG